LSLTGIVTVWRDINAQCLSINKR